MELVTWRWGFVFLLMVVTGAGGAQPVQYFLEVGETIKVFSAPSAASEELTELEEGERVQIAPKSSQGWRKIFFGSPRRLGWIQFEELESSIVIEETSSSSRNKTSSSRQVGGYGLTFNLSRSQQQPRTITLTDDVSVYDISPLESSSFWPSLHLDFSNGEKWRWRIEAGYRLFTFEGQAKLRGVGGGSDKQTPISIQQSFLTLGAGGQRFLGAESKWWGGFGIEVGQNLNIKVKAESENIPVDSKDKPFLFYSFITLGRDFSAGQFNLSPFLRGGIISTFSPNAHCMEFGLSTARTW